MGLFKHKEKQVEELKVKSLQEQFKDWLQMVHSIAIDPQLSREAKRSGLRSWLNKMSEPVYIQYFPQILEIIQNKKGVVRS